MLDRVTKEGASDKGKFNYMIRVDKSESHSVVLNSLQLHGLYSPWNSLGKNTGVGSCSLLQGIFPTQGMNPGLPHCRWILYQLSYQGSQEKREKYKYEKENMKNTLENQREIFKYHERLFCTMLSNKYNLDKSDNCLGN